jgi:hypothetical protein
MCQKVTIPEWDPIQMGSMDESELYRHFMFLGETGSGKTVSGIQPLCKAGFSAHKKQLSAGLVIDPKSEIGDYISGVLGNQAEKRMIRIRSGKKSPVLWQFENVTIGGRNGRSLMEEIMNFADSYNGQKEKTNDRFWVDSASQIIAEIINVDVVLFNHVNGLGARNIDRFWFNFYAFLELTSAESETENSSILISALNKRHFPSCLLKCLLNYSSKEYAQKYTEIAIYKKDNYLSHIAKLMEASNYLGAGFLRSGYMSLADNSGSRSFHYFWAFFIAFMEAYMIDGTHPLTDQLAYFRQFTFIEESVYSSIHATFNSLINEFMDKEFFAKISINPFEGPDEMLLTREVIENGQIVVYEPGIATSITTCVGKVLKASFFKALLVEERLNNPNARQFFYFCDEFHRFITHDEQSGEQSFLDRCRAYKVCCALATQSLSSLRYAFPGEKSNEAVNILVTNTGTKLFFRSTDPGTTGTLMDLIPEPSGKDRPHVVRVRPPSTMQPGECYYVQVNGRVGRGQVHV